jgi:hypothetical protein
MIDFEPREQFSVAERHAVTIDGPENALAGEGAEVLNGQKVDVSLSRRSHDGGSQWMLTRELEARGELKELGLSPAVEGEQRSQRGFPSVSVPVLSTTRVLTFSRVSSA